MLVNIAYNLQPIFHVSILLRVDFQLNPTSLPDSIIETRQSVTENSPW